MSSFLRDFRPHHRRFLRSPRRRDPSLAARKFASMEHSPLSSTGTRTENHSATSAHAFTLTKDLSGPNLPHCKPVTYVLVRLYFSRWTVYTLTIFRSLVADSAITRFQCSSSTQRSSFVNRPQRFNLVCVSLSCVRFFEMR